jgi:hypothetical protein
MDPISIAAATLVAKWVVEGLAKKGAEAAWSGLKKVYEVVSSTLASDTDSNEVLKRLEQKPTSEARTQELAEVLDARIKADPSFAQELRRLVQEAGSETATASFVTQVMDNARVGKITNIGTIHGGVSF